MSLKSVHSFGEKTNIVTCPTITRRGGGGAISLLLQRHTVSGTGLNFLVLFRVVVFHDPVHPLTDDKHRLYAASSWLGKRYRNRYLRHDLSSRAISDKWPLFGLHCPHVHTETKFRYRGETFGLYCVAILLCSNSGATVIWGRRGIKLEQKRKWQPLLFLLLLLVGRYWVPRYLFKSLGIY
jgi:hypothetical protein